MRRHYSLGTRIVAAFGRPAARELLDVLTCSEADRAALIGRLSQREDAAWLADLLIEIESDPDDISRLQVVDALRRTLFWLAADIHERWMTNHAR